nr:asparaginase domain-containing protein [Sulfurovum sp. bin170]
MIIDTGGTFNKVYNPITGDLDIDTTGVAIKSITKNWLIELTFINIIGKDSLDMVDNDREKILQTIQSSNCKSIIVIHGTDTIDKTAQYLLNVKMDREIILTGAMVPFSINPIEATANLTSAYGYLQKLEQNGLYIALNGIINFYNRVKKNREKGKFEETMVYKNKF